MKTISSMIKECLDNNEIKYDYNDEFDAFFFNMSCESADLDMYIQVRDEKYISFIAGLPIAIPKESHANICQVINDINAEAMVATLYLLKDSGKICGQSFVIVHQGEIHYEVILHHIAVTINIVDSRVKEIFRVAFGENNDAILAQLSMGQIEEDAQGNLIFN